MNPANIVQCLAELMSTSLNLNDTEVTQKEREVAQHISETITSFSHCNQFHYEENITLDLDENPDVYSNSDNEKSYQEIGSSDDGDDEWEDNVEPRHISNYSLEFMKEVVAFADETNAYGKRRRSWKTVHNRYKSIPAQNYITRFRNYIVREGTKRQKTNDIDENVFKKFLNAREKFLSVHDIDLCRWGLQAAKEYKVENFRASSFWLLGFKTRHSICSRRITNIVTRHEVENAEVVQQSEKQFLKEYNSLKSKYLSHEILNTDQVGVEKEPHSTRSLSFQGEKKTYGVVKSKHATTHCYTLQPTISLDGKVVGSMLLCLQEPEGKMGEQVKSRLFEPDNVVITCSSSGKLTTSLVSYWLNKCLLPSIDKKCLLLSDSWSGQNDEKLYDVAKSHGKNVKRIQIPQHTTSDIQPLDKYYNRQMKNFIKKLYNRVALDEIDINMYERNNIIKLVSLVHNQLCAPIFHKMIQYAWYASGYTKDNPSPFKNINDVCFPHEEAHIKCEARHCDETIFITCSYCAKKFCFNHFFVEYHYHE